MARITDALGVRPKQEKINGRSVLRKVKGFFREAVSTVLSVNVE